MPAIRQRNSQGRPGFKRIWWLTLERFHAFTGLCDDSIWMTSVVGPLICLIRREQIQYA